MIIRKLKIRKYDITIIRNNVDDYSHHYSPGGAFIKCGLLSIRRSGLTSNLILAINIISYFDASYMDFQLALAGRASAYLCWQEL
jgi:hypothetical protein